MRTFRKGEEIFAEGTPVSGAYFVFEGLVKIHMAWGAQKQLILNFAGKGEMIGFRGLAPDPVFPISATALDETVICFVERAFFQSMLEVNHRLTQRLLDLYARTLQESEKRMRTLALMDVRGRVSDMLLMLERKFGADSEGFIRIVPSRQDLAAYAGTTYETVFRTLSEWEEEKILAFQGKRIAILDRTRLEDYTR
ncbi:MAG: Crp/Fnr family transcriptional regulator [Siphonobacter aquaeclarae]|nr:Crp/Fnr family transcriptional regulator [Siphonobacter aquaeclarae]